MAQRRMFSPQIVDSDAFLDMSPSAQNLYFHLGMRADDDGFVGNPKKILRMIGGNDDDLRILVAKRFILIFENGVIVIKHWRLNNLIRKDWYKETIYLEEKRSLQVKENGSYTELVNETTTKPTHRLGKVSIGKDRLGKVTNTSEHSSQVNEIIDLFKEINPSYKKLFRNKTQRKSAECLLKDHGFDRLKQIISFLPQSNQTDYMPVITTPCQLEDKFGQLAAAWQKKKNNQPIIL